MNLGSRFLLGEIVIALSQTVMWVEMNEEEIGKGEDHLGRRGGFERETNFHFAR